jgi:hypothetical protein
MENKEKYLKYKAKYLHLTNDQTGGMSWGKFTTYFKSKPTLKSTLRKYKSKLSIYDGEFNLNPEEKFDINIDGKVYNIICLPLRNNNKFNNKLYIISIKDDIPYIIYQIYLKEYDYFNGHIINTIGPIKVNKRYYEWYKDNIDLTKIANILNDKYKNERIQERNLIKAFEKKKEEDELKRRFDPIIESGRVHVNNDSLLITNPIFNYLCYGYRPKNEKYINLGKYVESYRSGSNLDEYNILRFENGQISVAQRYEGIYLDIINCNTKIGTDV